MPDSLLERLTAAHQDSQMTGWNFSDLDGRLTADNPPWDFEEMCVAALSDADSALDLGTGGGEHLLVLCERLADRRPTLLHATEGWAPNFPVARRALGTQGIEVAEYDNEVEATMPFPTDSFDLVIARHESYDAVEIFQVLRPGGLLLTQQVHGRDAEELRRWFGGDPAYPDATLENHLAAAESAGLLLEGRGEWVGHMHFSDAQALVEYMGLVPWDVPGFTVGPHLATLTDLDAVRPIVVSQRRFWLAAQKPAVPTDATG